MKKNTASSSQPAFIEKANEHLLIGIEIIIIIFVLLYSNIQSSLISIINYADIAVGLLLIILFGVFTNIWLRNRFKIQLKSNSINAKIQQVLHITVTIVFILSSLASIFLIDSNVSSNFNFESILFIFSLLLFFIVIYDIFQVSKQPAKPMGYILKFSIPKIQEISDDYRYTLSTKTVLLLALVGLPIAIGYFLTNDIIWATIFGSTFISLVLGGYWLGYGLYRNFRWTWGLERSFNKENSDYQPISEQRANISNLKENLPFIFGMVTTILLILLFLIVILSNIFDLGFSSVFNSFILVFYLILVKLILSAIPKSNKNQPWHFFELFTFVSIISVFWTFSLKYILVSEFRIILNIPVNESISILLSVFLLTGIIVFFISNNRHLVIHLWENSYESNQLLFDVNQKLDDPKLLHLKILQKISEVDNDKEVVLRLFEIYSDLIYDERFNKNSGFINSLNDFLKSQLRSADDWDSHFMAFKLVHEFLDLNKLFANQYISIAEYNLRHLDSRVRYEAINLLGHIFLNEREKENIDEIFNLLVYAYENGEEKQKRLVIDGFKQFILSTSQYTSKIFEFISERVENELFGVATYIYSLYEIYLRETDEFDELIYNQGIKALESQNSPSKLGVIRLLKTNFPENEGLQNKYIELLKINLNDVDNVTGVRPNLVYTLTDIINVNSGFSNIIPILKDKINDIDNDVRTAIVQAYTDFYLQKHISFSEVKDILDIGINDEDYVVRLTVVKAIKDIIKSDITKLKDLITITEKSIADEAIFVQEEIVKSFEELYAGSDKFRFELKKYDQILNTIKQQPSSDLTDRFHSLFDL